MTAQAKKTAAPKRAAKASAAPKRGKEVQLLKTVLAQLEDAKAENIVTIDLHGKAALADRMVVATGRSNRHVGAIADQLAVKLREAGQRDIKIEGLPHADWVLVDAGDVIVHIFRPEVRNFYNIEKLWSDQAPDELLAS